MGAGRLRWLTKIRVRAQNMEWWTERNWLRLIQIQLDCLFSFISFPLLPSIFDSDGAMHLSSVNVVAIV
jgi:hypothetical protein